MSLTMKDVMTANCAISNAEMLTSNHCAALARELNKLLATDPVPPAGGEVEVLGYSVKGNRYAIRLTKAELLELYEGYTGDALVELVDRRHVTRLQAENAALQQRLNVADEQVDILSGGLRLMTSFGSGTNIAGVKTVAKQTLNRAAGVVLKADQTTSQ